MDIFSHCFPPLMALFLLLFHQRMSLKPSSDLGHWPSSARSSLQEGQVRATTSPKAHHQRGTDCWAVAGRAGIEKRRSALESGQLGFGAQLSHMATVTRSVLANRPAPISAEGCEDEMRKDARKTHAAEFPSRQGQVGMGLTALSIPGKPEGPWIKWKLPANYFMRTSLVLCQPDCKIT